MKRRRDACLIAICTAVAIWGSAWSAFGAEPVVAARTIRGGSYARQQPPAVLDGTVFERCNFSQATAGTELVAFKAKPLTFRRCNLVNVRLDRAWTIIRCNTAQVVIPSPPTLRERMLAERADAVAERVRLAARIAVIDATLPDAEVIR